MTHHTKDLSEIPHHRLKLLSYLRRAGKIVDDQNIIRHKGHDYFVRDAQVFGHKPILERVDGVLTSTDIFAEVVRSADVPLSGSDLLGEGAALQYADAVINDPEEMLQISPALLALPNLELFQEELQDADDASMKGASADCFKISQHIQLMHTLKINAKYSLADKAAQLAAIERERGRIYLRSEFSALIANRKVRVPEKFNKTTKSIKWKVLDGFKVWMDSPARTTYDDLVFAPAGRNARGNKVDLSRNFNIWVPPQAGPREGDCEMLLEHIRLIICNGDSIIFDYVMSWLAHLVQKPWDKPGVALVFISEMQGAGKGTFVEARLDMFGTVFARVFNQREQVVGKFAAYEKPPMLVVAEEAVFSGSPTDKNVLKSKITDPRETIELKNQTAFPVESFTRYIFNSNSPKAVPIEPHDRRFCVMNVNQERIGDRPYFKRLKAHLAEEATLEAFLYELSARDISKFEIRDFPNTAERMEMKEDLLSPEIQAIADILRAGELELTGTPDLLDMHKPTWVEKKVVRAVLASKLAQHGHKEASENEVGKFLYASGVVIDDRNRDARRAKQPEAGYKFAPLHEARQRFVERYSLNLSFVTPKEATDENRVAIYAKARHALEEAMQEARAEGGLPDSAAFNRVRNSLSALQHGVQKADSHAHAVTAFAILAPSEPRVLQ